MSQDIDETVSQNNNQTINTNEITVPDFNDEETLTTLNTAKAKFQRFYDDLELNSYTTNNSYQLTKNQQDPEEVIFSKSYIADLTLLDNGNLLVLGGVLYPNVTDLQSTLLTNTGNELTAPSNVSTVWIGFLVEFNPTTNIIEYGTLLDAPNGEQIVYSSVEIDPNGDIIALANTNYNLKSLNRLYISSNLNVHVVKLNGSDYSVLGTNTFGGSRNDELAERVNTLNEEIPQTDNLAIDNMGNIIIGGSTAQYNISEIDFPILNPEGVTDPTWDNAGKSGTFGFVVKLDTNLNLYWSRIYTGQTEEPGTGQAWAETKVNTVELDENNRIYIGGRTHSHILPMGLKFPLHDQITNGGYAINRQKTKPANRSHGEGFVTIFHSNGSLYTGTYIGADDDGPYDQTFEVFNTSQYFAAHTFYSSTENIQDLRYTGSELQLFGYTKASNLGTEKYDFIDWHYARNANYSDANITRSELQNGTVLLFTRGEPDTTSFSYSKMQILSINDTHISIRGWVMGSADQSWVEGHPQDAVWDIEIENNKLYVGGYVYGHAGDFPYISPQKKDIPDAFFTNRDQYLAVTGYITVFDLNDFNMTYSNRFTRVGANNHRDTITGISQIEVINGSVFYSGFSTVEKYHNEPYADFANWSLQPDILTGIGPYSRDRIAAVSNNYGYQNQPLIGVLNSTGHNVYMDNVWDNSDLIYNYMNSTQLDDVVNNSGTYHNTAYGSYVYNVTAAQAEANGHIPILVGNNSDIYLGYEDIHGAKLKTFSIVDTDQDGISDYNEVNKHQTNPNIADSDGDNLADGYEIYGLNEYSYHTNPLKADTDGDCINDGLELENDLNPTVFDANVDLDNDGINSYDEFQMGLDINNNDTDGDGLDDYTEVYLTNTNGSSADSDADGLLDPVEIDNGLDAWDPDMDNDGLNDSIEFHTEYVFNFQNGGEELRKTSLVDPDTDNDGLLDAIEYELYIHGGSNASNPVMFDTDYDGLSDYEELFEHNSYVNASDYDSDGLNDTEELQIYFTDPTNADSDEDGLTDYEEVITYGTDPWDEDYDDDQLTDQEEVEIYHTNPFKSDEDNDTLIDSVEVAYGSNTTKFDSDDDLLPDLFEYTWGLNSNLNETYLDLDGDNLSTYDEYLSATDPTQADGDNDNLTDLIELQVGTDPFSADSDADSLDDGYELQTSQTNPLSNDTDADLLTDDWELTNNFNATNADMDLDGLIDGLEVKLGSDPFQNDTDDDNIFDGEEYYQWSTSVTVNDTDDDQVTDGQELELGTDPLNEDTDNDTLADGYEIELGTSPLLEDTDNDDIADGVEVDLGIDPTVNDTDQDGLLDGEELYTIGTDPNATDSDGDGLPDFWEVQYQFANNIKYLQPMVSDAGDDPDGDGLTNMEEYRLGTNPTTEDTDNDGFTDKYEVDNADFDPLSPSDAEEANMYDRARAGASENPAAAWGAGITGLLSVGIFSQLVYQRMGKSDIDGEFL